MKKFSNISNAKVGQEPEKKEVKINEEDAFRNKIVYLIDNYLKVQTYGPINRYSQNATVKITGKELLTEALLSLLLEENSKSSIKILESIKSNIRDWEYIDDKIKEQKLNNCFKSKYRIRKIFEMYKDDEELLVEVLKIKINKIKSKSILESYNEYIKNSKIDFRNKEIINDIINEKFKN